MEKLLELKNVSLTYQTRTDEVKAVDDLSFYCNEGDFLSIIGPSGCGKTTVLSLIAGLISPSFGEISVKGIKTDAKNGNIGYMLQKDELFPWRTIEKNIYLPLEIKKRKSVKESEKVETLLKKYGIYEFRKNYPDELSGGMRQRVALIRTLISDPDLLLLDEPFSALDYQTRLSVCDDVYGIIKQEKKTAVLVTHDISEAIAMSDVIVVLSARPAMLKSVLKPAIRGNSPIKKRESPEFGVWFEKVWKELNL